MRAHRKHHPGQKGKKRGGVGPYTQIIYDDIGPMGRFYSKIPLVRQTKAEEK